MADSDEDNVNVFCMPYYEIIFNGADLHNCVEAVLHDSRTFPIIAMDCEWVTSPEGIRHPVGLLQISTMNRAYLIQMPRIEAAALGELNRILFNTNIIKVGVGIINDVFHLRSDYNLKVNGWFDLRYMSQLLGSEIFPPRSLQVIARQFLFTEINKNLKIRCSNWDAEILSTAQIHYAVNDVFIVILMLIKAMQIYNMMYHSKPYVLCDYVRGIFNTNIFNEQFSYETFVGGISKYINKDFL